MPGRVSIAAMPCSACSYDLAGLALDVPCPECNAPAAQARTHVHLGRAGVAAVRWLGFFLFFSGLVWISRSACLLAITQGRARLTNQPTPLAHFVRTIFAFIEAYGTPIVALTILFGAFVLRRAGTLTLPRLVVITLCALVVLTYHAAIMLGIPRFPRGPRTPGDPWVLLWASMRYAHNVLLIFGATLAMYQTALAIQRTRLAQLILPIGVLWAIAEWQAISTFIAFLWGRPEINVANMLPEPFATFLATSARHIQWSGGLTVAALALILAVRVRRLAANQAALSRTR